jgi:hypothetical protein
MKAMEMLVFLIKEGEWQEVVELSMVIVAVMEMEVAETKLLVVEVVMVREMKMVEMVEMVELEELVELVEMIY